MLCINVNHIYEEENQYTSPIHGVHFFYVLFILGEGGLICWFLFRPVFVWTMLAVSLDFLFLIGPLIFSNVYFVRCLVYPMLTMSLDCLFLVALRFSMTFISSCVLCSTQW